MPYVICDAIDDRYVGPSYRTYATPQLAKRAAQRAANSSGRDVAYGWAKDTGFASSGNNMKTQFGVCTPRNKGE